MSNQATFGGFRTLYSALNLDGLGNVNNSNVSRNRISYLADGIVFVCLNYKLSRDPVKK